MKDHLKKIRAQVSPARREGRMSKNKGKVQQLPAHEATQDGPTGVFWTLRLEPTEFYVVAENIALCLMVIKNLGPGIVRFYAGYGDQQDLAPGKLRATTAYAKITVESKEEEKSALVEMQFLPSSR